MATRRFPSCVVLEPDRRCGFCDSVALDFNQTGAARDWLLYRSDLHYRPQLPRRFNLFKKQRSAAPACRRCQGQESTRHRDTSPDEHLGSAGRCNVRQAAGGLGLPPGWAKLDVLPSACIAELAMPTNEELYRQAEKLKDEGKLAEAVKKLEELTAASPDYTIAL